MLLGELYIRSLNHVNKMLQAVNKFLILNGKVSIPGIGLFYIRRKPASFDFLKKIFIAPSEQVLFDPGVEQVDKHFYTFVSREQQIEEAAATTSFAEFSAGIARELEANGKVQLPGLGVLLKNETGKAHFEAARPLSSLYPNVTAERTIQELPLKTSSTANRRKELTETPQTSLRDSTSGKKDYWWLFALLLAALAVAAIAFYYKQNGSLR